VRILTPSQENTYFCTGYLLSELFCT